jgi:hypothetical protein
MPMGSDYLWNPFLQGLAYDNDAIAVRLEVT